MVKILSFDIGIKNLALCLLEITNTDTNINPEILLWEIVDISTDKIINNTCSVKHCKSNAKYTNNGLNQYCKRHAKSKYNTSGLKLCDEKFSKKKIIKMKVKDLKEKMIDLGLIKLKEKITKKEIIIKYDKYFDKKYLNEIPKQNAKDVNLIDLGKNINIKITEILKKINGKIDIVLIENQIGPLANRMKTIQGMLAQYFIMNNIENIEFISSNNKLKDFDIIKTEYKDRKKNAIKIMNNILEKSKNKKMESIFKTSKKKDDLSDSYLQGLWYIKNKYN
jgi:hypothetical protein